jgi:phosphoglycerate dehydrogenase-like enzyme
MREESWPPLAGRLLEGKTVGVLGFGRIAKKSHASLKRSIPECSAMHGH